MTRRLDDPLPHWERTSPSRGGASSPLYQCRQRCGGVSDLVRLRYRSVDASGPSAGIQESHAVTCSSDKSIPWPCQRHKSVACCGSLELSRPLRPDAASTWLCWRNSAIWPAWTGEPLTTPAGRSCVQAQHKVLSALLLCRSGP
eukprot:125772-Chlamydomonas_euryale.AAC.2